jgi:hypothetical protein
LIQQNEQKEIGLGVSINSFSETDLSLCEIESDTDSIKELQDSLQEFGVNRVKKPPLQMIMASGTRLNSKLNLFELNAEENFDVIVESQEKLIQDVQIRYTNSNLQEELKIAQMEAQIQKLICELKNSEVIFNLI